MNAVAQPGQAAVDSLQDALALAPDGTEEIIDGTLYAAVNALSQPGICRFGGYRGPGLSSTPLRAAG